MKKLVLGFAVALSGLTVAWAKDAAKETTVMATPSSIEWKSGPASLPAGAQMAALEGDFAKPAYFAVRLKLPAGYKVPAHYHPVQERVTVVEGSFLLGHGDKFDEAALKEYPAGSYLSMPKGMRHFAMAKTDCVIQLQTVGPWGITYVNPADDPRNQKSAK